MLPPSFDGSGMSYNFYSLKENRVFSVRKSGGGGEESDPLPEDHSEVVGSSNGWLALFNPRNRDLFLSNPLSRRHVKLPAIYTLSIPFDNLTDGSGCVTKVVISSSPSDEQNCLAMMTYGPADRLAFCQPGRSTDWTPIGDYFELDPTTGVRFARSYQDFVYSGKRGVFHSVTQDAELETWDLLEPSSLMTPVDMDTHIDEANYPFAYRSEEELTLKESCDCLHYLVSANSVDFFLVSRYVMGQMRLDGSPVVDPDDVDYGELRHKTIGFDVHRYCEEDKALRYMDRSLDGLALFVGFNHSFALSASEFPELKPDSIYFTDTDEVLLDEDGKPMEKYGGHDIGIFNYRFGSFSPCYYPSDLPSMKLIHPTPMWFTPSLN